MTDPTHHDEHTNQASGEHVERLAGLEESRAAVDRIIASAERMLRIFERDLSDSGYRSPHRVELIEQFLRRRQGNRLLLVVHDARHLERDAARLMNLYRHYTHAVEIHQTLEAAKVATDALVLADDSHYWHRLHQDLPRAVVGSNDSAGARPLLQRFDEIWDASEAAASGTVLGL
jgi:hypothetical protein